MRILGISAFYHDSAAALIEDGRIVAAAQEERFSRIKHDPAFPGQAIEWCLQAADCTLSDVDFIAFYEKPLRKFARLYRTYLQFAPSGPDSFARATSLWLGSKIRHKRMFAKALAEQIHPAELKQKLVFTEHHESHAASAFFPSPFAEAATLTLDGVGEWATTSLAYGNGSTLDLLKEIRFPHSLGLLYAAFTAFAGFKVNSGEYKLMGLAPYGTPRFTQQITDNLIDIKSDGSFRLNLDYFDYCTGRSMVRDNFADLFGFGKRTADEPLEQHHMDLAASIQEVTENIVLKLGRFARRETGSRHLCMAGGVALNCVANGKLLREDLFDRIWVQPAAGDAGGALGAALAVYHDHLGHARVVDGDRDAMRGAYLGPAYDESTIVQQLDRLGAQYTVCDDAQLSDLTAQALAQGQTVGWFQGAMEFGPRALGNRSILADPRGLDMQKRLNLAVKNRESFRPFAPSVLDEDAAEWFDIAAESPYMLFVAPVSEKQRLAIAADGASLSGLDQLHIQRSSIPAVTHVNYSARVHTVSARNNARFHALLTAFKQKTGCPVLVDTSFNVRGEPIVCTPEQAYKCFMGTDLDMLVVGNHLMRKEDQALPEPGDYADQFQPD